MSSSTTFFTSALVITFVELAFRYAGIELEWKGTGTGEKGLARSVTPAASATVKIGAPLIEIDPRYFRPTEVDALLADPAKARTVLGWQPRITFGDLVKIMMDSDMELAGLAAPGEGERILRDKGILWTKNRTTAG